jgi:hypothetical protein
MKKTMALMLRWIWQAMGVLGVLALVSVFVMSINDMFSPKAAVDETFYPSADGKYIAKRIVRYRFRLISSYCYEEIYVYPSSIGPGAKGKGQGVGVYMSSCASSLRSSNTPVLEWQGDRKLALRYWISSDRPAKTTGQKIDPVRVDAMLSW